MRQARRKPAPFVSRWDDWKPGDPVKPRETVLLSVLSVEKTGISGGGNEAAGKPAGQQPWVDIVDCAGHVCRVFPFPADQGDRDEREAIMAIDGKETPRDPQ